MRTMASQITSLTIVCSTVYSGANHRKHQSSTSLAFVWGIHRWPVNSPHKWPATRKMFHNAGPLWGETTSHLSQRTSTLLWSHNGRDGVSNHQPHGCLLNRSFRRRPNKTSKLRLTGFCVGNSPVTGEFPAQMASYAENVSIWRRPHDAENVLMSWRHDVS